MVKSKSNQQSDMPNLTRSSHQLVPRKANPGLFLIAIVAVAWWLLTRPYLGIGHDGVLYSVQALKHLFPQRFEQDLFFLYGSQDDYTLFSHLHAWLIARFGLDQAFLMLSVTGAAIWLYALVKLLHRWLLPVPLLAAVILVLSWDPYYNGLYVFSYGELFATPRLFAEALVLLSLSFWLGKKPVLAWGTLVTAFALHPLVALAGLGVLAWSLLSTRFNRPVLLWGILLAFGLLAMQLADWVGLSPIFDPAWRRLLELRSPFLFPSQWGRLDWIRLSLDASMLYLAARYLQAEAGKLASWILPVLALGVVWSLSAELTGTQLAVAAQLHRVQWLAHLLAIAMVAPLCISLWQRDSSFHRYLAVVVAGGLLFPINLGGVLLPVLYGVGVWHFKNAKDNNSPPNSRLLLSVLALSAAALWLYVFKDLLWFTQYNSRPIWLIALVQPPLAIGIFLAVSSLQLKAKSRGLWVYAICLWAVAIPNWDRRSPASLYTHPARVEAMAPVQALIPEGSVVYWESAEYQVDKHKTALFLGYQWAWLWLNRAHYVSYGQGSGIVFYRRTAMEFGRRLMHLRQWDFRDSAIDRKERNKLPAKQPLTMARLKGACSDPVLDFLITDTKLPSASLDFSDPLTDRKFSVYDCGKIKATKLEIVTQ